jgi:glycosyltransferase involved in cell wall biosynthesis
MGGTLIRDIILHGHSVVCFAPVFEPASARFLQNIGAQIVKLPFFRLGFSPFADRRCIKQMIRFFRRISPHAVAGYTPKCATLAASAARNAGVERRTAIIGDLGPGFAEFPAKPSRKALKTFKAQLRRAFQLCDTAIFLNEENYKLLIHENLLSDDLRQFPVNGSGLDLDNYPEVRLPPLDKGVLFLFAGRLDKHLGIKEYCNAARILKKRPGNHKFLIAGPELSNSHGMQLSELKNYRDVILYIGQETDLRPYIVQSHVVVLPGTGDAIPRTLTEAAALGRPIITSTARGYRVAVSEEQNGLLVTPNDPIALAGAMTRILQRPDLIPHMARASRILAEDRFDYRRINGLLFSALEL